MQKNNTSIVIVEKIRSRKSHNCNAKSLLLKKSRKNRLHIFTRRDAHFHALQHIQNLFWALRMEGANMVLKIEKTYESRRKTRGYL
jgi:hypothetical protein